MYLVPGVYLVPEGCVLSPGGVLSPRGCLLWGVCLLWGGRLLQGCVCSRGACLLRGGVCSQGGCLLGGCLLPGGYLVRHSPPVDRMTHASENITLSQTSFAGSKNPQHTGISKVNNWSYLLSCGPR